MEQKNKKKNTAAVVRELIQGTADSLGYMLWDVEYVKEGAEMVLRITIDSENGIGIEDCEKMHRAIDPVLDEADPIEVAYRLEVSSPGVERTLTRDEHFEYCLGVEVEAKLFKPFNGMKVVRGILNDVYENSFVIVCGEDAYEIEKKAAAKVSTVFNWDD
ncbi:MAG: ribosome maturation factor RimP [Ruminococcaceae bacterium]|nr:ribosome maturation factor RimP [Oscillospiraceae bacterium]